ncbi:MAG: FAD-binding dehydrogenase [Pseudomonadota bacterium]
MQTDILIIGAGLAGLVAAHEAVARGRKVTIVDQEGPQNLGGQAFWSLGGLFMIDTPEQRRGGLRDSRELAAQDWMGSAQFDRAEDEWPRKWADAFLDFAAGEMRPWLHGMGMRWFPLPGWAERGGAFGAGHGNSIPRFHITWGTGPGVLEPFLPVAERCEMKYRHRVTSLIIEDGVVVGAAGDVLEPSDVPRGASSPKGVVGDFEIRAESVIVTSGGIGGNHDLVRKAWPVERLGTPPDFMVSGVPDHVDGAMMGVAERVGAQAINGDRMWHYTEGLRNWDPIWPLHGIRVLPGPSSIWLDALGHRMEAPCLPGFDTLSTLKRILSTGHGHSWFVLTQKIIEKEFALSGSEQNEDLTSKSWKLVLTDRLSGGAPKAVEAFKQHGKDFVVASDLETLVEGMNAKTDQALLDPAHIRAQIEARDRQLGNKVAKDAQVIALRASRKFIGDRLIRTAKPHRILDPAAGPLIGVKLNILTRKSLGGLHTDLQGRVLRADGSELPGLYAAGEVAGFGGGGYHGYNALEGTFLGGCMFSGRAAGRAA